MGVKVVLSVYRRDGREEKERERRGGGWEERREGWREAREEWRVV